MLLVSHPDPFKGLVSLPPNKSESHLCLTIDLLGEFCYHAHFTDEKTEPLEVKNDLSL